MSDARVTALLALQFTRPFIDEVLTLLAHGSNVERLTIAVRLVDRDPQRARAWLGAHRFQADGRIRKHSRSKLK